MDYNVKGKKCHGSTRAQSMRDQNNQGLSQALPIGARYFGLRLGLLECHFVIRHYIVKLPLPPTPKMSSLIMPVASLLNTALAKRAYLIDQLSSPTTPTTGSSKTDCFRVFHGTVDGVNGLNIDRYGDAWLIQTFHKTLSEQEVEAIHKELLAIANLPVVYNDRSNKNSRIINILDAETEAYARSEKVISENDILFTSKLPPSVTMSLLFILDKLAIYYCYPAVNVSALTLS